MVSPPGQSRSSAPNSAPGLVYESPGGRVHNHTSPSVPGNTATKQEQPLQLTRKRRSPWESSEYTVDANPAELLQALRYPSSYNRPALNRVASKERIAQKPIPPPLPPRNIGRARSNAISLSGGLPPYFATSPTLGRGHTEVPRYDPILDDTDLQLPSTRPVVIAGSSREGQPYIRYGSPSQAPQRQRSTFQDLPHLESMRITPSLLSPPLSPYHGSPDSLNTPPLNTSSPHVRFQDLYIQHPTTLQALEREVAEIQRLEQLNERERLQAVQSQMTERRHYVRSNAPSPRSAFSDDDTDMDIDIESQIGIAITTDTMSTDTTAASSPRQSLSREDAESRFPTIAAHQALFANDTQQELHERRIEDHIRRQEREAQQARAEQQQRYQVTAPGTIANVGLGMARNFLSVFTGGVHMQRNINTPHGPINSLRMMDNENRAIEEARRIRSGEQRGRTNERTGEREHGRSRQPEGGFWGSGRVFGRYRMDTSDS
ncbi:hypothetical protein BJ508DRAFT_325763 [Ascobolus immersus RN42]|uniref:Uncharacterized protein n=1 Tax=Ascobolus immersus RN42 TaxID=1160509 RepID=A0A3N4IDK7_ASCIM|nr:hypothetical protein BJ508DRAFT_325763 [Ascobolus immersus RN42]